jgi:putative endonuclease
MGRDGGRAVGGKTVDDKAVGGKPARAERSAAAERGVAAETAALAWLERRGLKLLARNWRCRWGELDLVMQDGDCVVMVEVRLRASDRFGGAAASVDANKRARLISAARQFLARRPDSPCRFDVVTMSAPDGRGLEWIRDAFGA